jgi:hypothetical protein
MALTFRLLAASAAVTLLAGPAWADCADEIQAFDDQIIAADTGAAVDPEAPMETAAGPGGEPLSPQEQRAMLRNLEAADRERIDLLIAEARAAAQEGDEDACMARLREARALVFTE